MDMAFWETVVPHFPRVGAPLEHRGPLVRADATWHVEGRPPGLPSRFQVEDLA